MRISPPRSASTGGVRRRGLLAIAAVVIGYAVVMQALGWAQTSYFALVRSASHGTAQIDRYHWETRDESYHRGHYYSVKAPGLPLLTLPLYKGLHAVHAERASRSAARNAHRHGSFRWYRAGVPSGLYGDDLDRTRRIRAAIEDQTPLVWVLGLLGVVAPAALLLLLVRAVGERVEPGFGTIAAVTLGAGTLILPFATLFFSHVLSAMLAFAAFAVAWREREGPPRLALVAVAGLLAGLAVTSEYPVAIAGAIVGLYALARGDALRRGLAYAGGVAAGVAPLLAYNVWAFGSATHFSYADAVKVQGLTGHDVLGLNDGGFFGIGVPSPRVAVELLFSSKGLFTLSPVLAMSIAGLGVLYRHGRRAEALVIGAVALAFLAYNSGYYLPFGGGSPGPRFLIPMLPFLAVPLAIAYRRWPALTAALAIPSALMMMAATVTLPMIGNGDTGYWAHVISIGRFEHTILSVMGAGNGWPALAPFLAAILAAAVLAATATPRVRLARNATVAALGVVGWACLAILAPRIPANTTGPNHAVLPLVVGCAAVSLLVLSLAAALEFRPRAPALSGRPGEAQRGEATS
jgi:hypothetical protein